MIVRFVDIDDHHYLKFLFIIYWIIMVDETRNLYWFYPLFLGFENKEITLQKKNNRVLNSKQWSWTQNKLFSIHKCIIFSLPKKKKRTQLLTILLKFITFYCTSMQGKVKKKLLVSQSRYNLSLIIYWSITS